MKKSDRVVLTTAGIGVAVGVGIWMVWPDTPWYVYVGLAFGTLVGIPNALKVEAEQKIARKVLDE